MEPAAIVQAFNKIGAPRGNLKQCARCTIQLHFKPIFAADFDDTLSWANIEAVDVIPAIDRSLRYRSNRGEYLLKT